MPSSQSHIAGLAAAVAHHTKRVDDYLSEHNLPHPSFDVNSPTDLQLPPDIEASRIAVLRASQELNDIDVLQHPRDLLFNHHVRLYSTLVRQC